MASEVLCSGGSNWPLKPQMSKHVPKESVLLGPAHRPGHPFDSGTADLPMALAALRVRGLYIPNAVPCMLRTASVDSSRHRADWHHSTGGRSNVHNRTPQAQEIVEWWKAINFKRPLVFHLVSRLSDGVGCQNNGLQRMFLTW